MQHEHTSKGGAARTFGSANRQTNPRLTKISHAKKIRDSAILNHAAGTASGVTEVKQQQALLKTGALQNAIFNSANAMLRDVEKELEAGFFRYLTKPIKVNEFMSALDDALKFAETGKFSEMGLVDIDEVGQIL